MGSVSSIDPDQLLAGLDEAQQAVATSLGGPVVVIAGAGSGKTRAITRRVAYGCVTGALSQRAVLAVTFTTRAAGEMRARLRHLGVPNVQARTFHSAALRQARYFWPKVHGVELPEVQSSTFGFVAEAAGRAGLPTEVAMLRDLANEISWAKVCNVPASRYAELASQAGRSVADAPPEVVGAVFSDYELAKRRAGVIDFDDILLCNVALLHEFPEVADEVRSSYRHLVVDEFQDVSPLQRSLLGLWLGDSDDNCVVGDPNQAIHGFAGGNRRYLLDFARDFPGAQTIELARNYRSTPEILSAANRVMSSGAARVGVKLQAVRKPGAAVSTVGCSTEADEAAKVAEWLADARARGHEWSDLAVLYRINAQAPAVEAALSERRIPYQVRGAERFWERPEVRQALRALQSEQPEADQAPGQKVRDVMTAQGWKPQPPTGSGRVRERWESWQAMVELADELATNPELGYAGVVAAMTERSQIEHVPSTNSVTLSTMHAAKGLEWPAVAVIGVHEGTVPFVLATDAEQLAEEQRLLHVAFTRARDELRVSWSWARRGADGRRGPSRFLDGIAGVGVSEAPPPRKRKQKRVEKCRVCGKPVRTPADMKLQRHEDCPSDVDIELLDRLKEWRLAVARSQNVPAYVVFTDATLTALAEARPTNLDGLGDIRGVGESKLGRYGVALLQLVAGRSPEEVISPRQK